MADPQRSSLTIQGGPLAGRSFLLPEGVGRGTIGSDPTCNVLVPLPGVSARHVALHRRAAGTFVVDQGSARGVFINDARVTAEHELRDGDVLWLGPPGDADSVAFKCRLVVSRTTATAAPPSAPVPAPPPAVPPADDFFVSDAADATEPTPRQVVEDRDLFVGDPAAATPVLPEELSDAFFVGSDIGGAKPIPVPVQAEVPSAVFFVQDGAPSAPVPGSGEFFVAAEAAVAEVPPTAALPPVLPVDAPPVPGPVPATAAASAPVAAAPAQGAAPREQAVPTRPSAGAAPPPSARPATAARGPAAPRAVSDRGPGVTGAPRMRPSGLGPGATAKAGVRSSRPRPSGGGSPTWLRPLLAVVGLVVAVGVAYAWLMLVGRPSVASVEPQQARVGDTLVVTGERLGTAADTVVLLDGTPAQIAAGNAGRIEAKVPDLHLAPGERRDVQLQVRVGRKRSTSVAIQVRMVPKIDGVSPDVASPGEELLIAGSGWATGGVQVLFDGKAGEVRDVAPAYLRVRVPPLESPQGTTVQVVVASGPDRSDPTSLVLGRLPVVTSVEPRSAAMGDVITVRGRGLRGTPAEHTALIGGTPALVFAASDGHIELMVPSQAPVGEEPLELHVRGYPNPALTTLTISPAIDPIALRFVAEPLSDGGRVRAAVSTALGPVFVLSYAGGRSAAERAAEAVRRLNAAVGALRDRDVRIELRLGPSTAVIGTSASREPLLEVTNEDAQAYVVAPTRGRTTALTRGRLANWWLAELRDVTGLLGRGERPRSTELYGPEARFITDVYDAAMRGGGPVTHAVAAGLRPGVRDGLRAMALRVPATVPEPGT